ncbi:MAG: efflux RND transporter periplasmic adaptor subunit [Desulfobacca sp.]|nr:efflux RND transporter periplasmic adaptor subunit [Desulfobacca sp.]
MRPSPRRYLLWGLGLGLSLSLAVAGGLYLAGYRVMRHALPSPAQQPLETQKGRKIKYWVAPMDPTYISDKPGKSPMGMDLIPVYEDEGAGKGVGTIAVDPNILQSMGVRTARAEIRPLTRIIRAVGKVEYDERRLSQVNTKVDGWVERLYINATGEPVRKGQTLLAIYSPELVSAQQEYLLALNNLKTIGASPVPEVAAGARRLADASRRRLQYWDIPPAQIMALEETGRVNKQLTLTSPVQGIVTRRMVTAGQFVRAGMPLLEVADLSTVWVEADVYEYELPWVEVGQKAHMILEEILGKTYQGRVDYLYPYLQGSTRTAKVRLAFSNPKLQLKPEMFAQVQLESTLHCPVVAVPTEAIMDTGEKQHVFLALGQGRFEPREVKVGLEGSDGWRQILSGLQGGEVVVTSAQFLLDSESRFREAVAKQLAAPTPEKQGAPPPARPPHHHH